eukprot:maker-scaffold507_size152468-snap-gene-0.35 protein:Tk11920 transcript:maker-scaffold507_size152468-snap-gene-0.35-mRNA-1 annotation:"-related lipid transfer protein 3"
MSLTNSVSDVESERDYRARRAARTIMAHGGGGGRTGRGTPPSEPMGTDSVDSGSVRGRSGRLRPGALRAITLRDGRTGIPVIVSDDIVSGTRREGWMSPIRRFFCLLVTFDFLFTGILWTMTIIVTGRDLKKAMRQQVLEYTIHDSMFDCVMAAGCRFTMCVLMYSFLYVNHWWPIAITTSGSTLFVIAKIFQYQWTRIGTPIFDVVLVMMCLILSWVELWVLDSRVLPLEKKASEIYESLEHEFEDQDLERAPLLINDRSLLQRYVESTQFDGSVANFYSPLESPEESGDELEEGSLVLIPKKFKRKHPLTPMEVEYRRQGQQALEAAWNLLNSEGWKLEKENDIGDTVHSRVIRGNKKVFKLTVSSAACIGSDPAISLTEYSFQGLVTIPPKLLLEELFYQIEEVPSWNPTLKDCKTIQPIDSHTDISYQVAAEAAGGVVSTRDFVNLRYWQIIEGVYFSAGVSIAHPAMPHQPKRVRGENGPGGWAMRPVLGQPDQCLFQWLLDTDLKGWIPQSIIDSALSGTQFEYIDNIRKRASYLHQIGRVQDHLDHNQQASASTSLNSTITLNSVA